MSEHRKIAVIKTGWSEDYLGGPIEADHAFARDSENGHEKYNFLPGPDGRFFGYTPPIGKELRPPQPREKGGWLIFAVAKRPRVSGLYLVGWYEDATFADEYTPRPEYNSKAVLLPLDDENQPYSYAWQADTATAIPKMERDFSLVGDRLKRTPIAYLRGNDGNDRWREALAKKLLAARKRFNASGRLGSGPRVRKIEGGICADPIRRKEVEEAAIKRVLAEFPAPKFEVIDRQKDNCGFDLLVRNPSGGELHIEVKGTAMEKPHFLMSRREYAYMQTNPKHWRLAMVTNALVRPKLKIMNRSEVRQEFFWEEFCWHATAKP